MLINMLKKGDKVLIKSTISEVLDQTVIFEGIQEVGFEGYPDIPIYTITQRFDNHPEGSTVARVTLENYGYVFPKEAP